MVWTLKWRVQWLHGGKWHGEGARIVQNERDDVTWEKTEQLSFVESAMVRAGQKGVDLLGDF